MRFRSTKLYLVLSMVLTRTLAGLKRRVFPVLVLAARRVSAADIHIQPPSPPPEKGEIGSRLQGLSGSSSDEKLGHRAI
jgi:hypothetical protein